MTIPAISKANIVVQAYHPMVGQGNRRDNTPKTAQDGAPPPEEPSSAKSNSESDAKINGEDLTQTEKQQVEALQKRDLEVKDHEMAHVAAGGQYISGAINYTYQTGPDGKKYAVGGDVSIDMSEVPGDPNATISKMQAVQRAALAPASPSQTDRMVAAKATQLEAKARMESLLGKVQQYDNQKATDPRLDARSATSRYENQTIGTTERGGRLNIAA